MNTMKTVTATVKMGAELFCTSDENKKQIQHIADIVDLSCDAIELLGQIVKQQHPEIQTNYAVKKHVKRIAKKHNLSLLTVHIVEDVSGRKELAFSMVGGNSIAFANELGISLMTPEQNNVFMDYIFRNPCHQKEVIYDCTKDLLPA